MVRSAVVAWAIVLASASGLNAQSSTTGTSEGTSSSSAVKPATTTFEGDTGLWFVPTAEVLASGQWSGSGYRRGTNYIQGFSNIGDFAGTVAYGLGDRAEVFGSFIFVSRIDRDLRPIFTSDQTVGGIIDRYPRIRTGWSGNNVGDLSVGAKVSLLPRTGLHPVALAVKGVVKIPTGDDEVGVSTGKADFSFDVIASRELRAVAEIAGYAGYEWRGQPDGFDIPSGAFRWGGGAGFPSRTPLRAQLELNGIVPSNDFSTITGAPIVANDGSISPLVSNGEKITRATAAATWQAKNGFFAGVGLSWNVPRRSRDGFGADSSPFADYVDWQVRIGFHPGARHATSAGPSPAAGGTPPPAVPATPPEAAPPVVATAPPTPVAEPPLAAPSQADANRVDDPPVTPERSSPRGGEGAPPSAGPRNYVFDDVHFDYDRYSLRPEAMRVLDQAVTAMRADASLNLEIEGHTCNIGTAEYNLALGDRRANAVRQYLLSAGVPDDRLRSISYGEERPKYENDREETRRLNRRAALVVNLR